MLVSFLRSWSVTFYLLAIGSSAWALDAPDVKPSAGTYDHPVTVVIKATPKEADVERRDKPA